MILFVILLNIRFTPTLVVFQAGLVGVVGDGPGLTTVVSLVIATDTSLVIVEGKLLLVSLYNHSQGFAEELRIGGTRDLKDVGK